MNTDSIRLCRIVTVPITFKALFSDQIRYLAEQGFEITLVSSPGPELDEMADLLGVRIHPIPMERNPAPYRDIRALIDLIRLLKTQDFDILHSSTPKAGLLAAIAGYMLGIPVRIHTYTGQVWVEMRGFSRSFMKLTDRIIGRLSTHCFTDSISQREFLLSERVIPAEKLEVIGSGSVSGVDLERFNPKRWRDERVKLNGLLSISPDATVIGFIGRLRADKGIGELVRAFKILQDEGLNVHLLLIGPEEYNRRPLDAHVMAEIHGNPGILATGYVSDPERYLSIVDIFAFPSYREGFGSAVIESAAMGIPTVATRVQGCVDSVIDGVTGYLVPPKNVEALVVALRALVLNPEKRREMGEAARERAIQEFDSKIVNQLVAERLRALYHENQRDCCFLT